MSGLNRRSEFLSLLAITALAAFFRLYHLSTLPPGDGHDVAQYGVDALHILNGARPIFLESNFGREVLFSYLVALTYLFTGPGTLGIHLVSALAGVLTIPAVFLTARELFNEKRNSSLVYLPLLAAFLAATSYWHLNWSRVGLRVILVPLFAALIVFALMRGLRTGRRLWFAAAGALLGLSLYSYQSARLLPALVVAAFVLHGLLRRRWMRVDTANFLITAAIAALVFMPLGIYARQHPGALSVRIRQTTVVDAGLPLNEQMRTLAAQASTALLTYSFRGDTDPQFTIAGRPSLDPFLSVGFIVGILIALWRFRRSPYLFLLVWLAIMTAPAMVADQAATAKRYLGAFPAVMILTAVGLLLPLEWLRRRPTTVERQATTTIYFVLLVTGLCFSTATSWRDYFIVWASDPDLPTHFQVDQREIGAAIAGIDPAHPIWLSPYPPDQPVIQLHAGLRPNLRGYNGRFCVPYRDPVGDNGADYIILPGFQDSSLAKLQELFPEGETTDGSIRPRSDRPYFHLFRIPPGSAVAGSSQPEVANWEDQIALLDYEIKPQVISPDQTITVTLTYKAIVDGTADYTAFVHLLGAPNPDSGSTLWAQADSPPCGGGLPTGQWREGDIIRDTITLPLPSSLPEGEFELATGFYTWPDLVRLTDGKSGEDSFNLGVVQAISR